MACRSLLHALLALGLTAHTGLALANDALLSVAASLQADAVRGLFGTARALKVALTSEEEVSGSAEVQALGDARCRSVIELVYDRPYEQRGVLITGVKRRSVQEGACARLAALVTEQAQREAAAIEAQVRAAARPAVASVAVNRATVAASPRPATGKPAVIKPEPVKLAAAGIASKPRAQPSYQLTVLKRAVLRDEPSFKGAPSAMVPAGQVRLGRLVPQHLGWYEVLDLASGKAAYIHESMVAQGPPAGRV
ncbi:MAG: hypothetical protein EPN60_09455 [Nevskiaceae bacterium]|nr:MAG: hypothetical protein EPO48_06285 [Nevskiaceae bacterium]TAM26790.1 MAG: hypothetical protein EPN60_09455 [Nevskiaceae bacterium]